MNTPGHATKTHHSWCSKRRCSVIVPSGHLPRWHSVPPEVQLPVEASPCLVGCSDVLEGLVTYHIDDWTHHRSPVQDDSGKERLKPSFGALWTEKFMKKSDLSIVYEIYLAMSVEEGNNLTFHVFSAEQSRPDESRSLHRSKNCGRKE